MAIPAENSIFKRIGKRILDPYAGKETLEIRRKDNDEVKIQEQVRVITMAQIARVETSPLDDLIEGFHRDLQVQDSVDIERARVVPEAKAKPKAPPAAKPAAPKLTRREQLEMRREERIQRRRGQDADVAAGEEEPNGNDADDNVLETAAEWTQEQFWIWIAGLGWGDRSDRPNTRTAEAIVRRMSEGRKRGMLARYQGLYAALAENLNNFLRGYDMGEVNRKAIISHIIARGENFYNAICADPDFASYLISDASRSAEQNEFIDFSLLLE